VDVTDNRDSDAKRLQTPQGLGYVLVERVNDRVQVEAIKGFGQSGIETRL